MSAPFLIAEELRKKRDGNPVLDGISLALHPGQSGRVLERSGGVLEPQVEQLLTLLVECADELGIGCELVAEVIGLQRDPPPAARTSS